jgi:hypothetical protein
MEFNTTVETKRSRSETHRDPRNGGGKLATSGSAALMWLKDTTRLVDAGIELELSAF